MPRPGDDVHVWRAFLDRRADPFSFLGCLSPDERVRAARFHFDRDRDRFIVARGVLRELLGRYLGLPPERISFVYGPRGKPALALREGAGLRFNVSHSEGLALFAFATGREVGVDVELQRPVAEAARIARRFFSAREAGELRALPESERSRSFLRCWTRKEAFIKATGDGLARRLDAFDVSVRSDAPARLLGSADVPGEADRWWLEDLEPAADCVAALAVEGRPARVLCLTLNHFSHSAWDGSRYEVP